MKAPSDHLSDQRASGRALKKSAILGAALALLLFISNVQLVHAASITVNTTDDELNVDGDCSLREAIQAANTNAAVDACPAGEPVPTIDIITFGVTGTITLISGPLAVSDDLTIDGPGAAQLTLSGNNSSRVMEVSVAVTLNLSDVTVANGSSGFGGGGIQNSGTLTITNSTFAANHSSNGGAIVNDGTITVNNSFFSANVGDTAGAILNFQPGTVSVANTTFSGNSSPNYGGAIENYATFTVANSTFVGNSAPQDSGAIRNNSSATFTIVNSTFSENSAGSLGGAILNLFGTLSINSSTFSGNSAGTGGALMNFGATPLTLQNTVVANSLSGGNCSGPITDGGGNLSWPDSTCPGTNQDPLLDPAELQDNGGPTKTIALQPGSPAIDSAVAANCPATDQRGVMRPQGAACDIGAYELEQAPADSTAPTIAITTPADGATYLLGQVVLADYACEDEPGGSGLASCVGTVPNGSAIDTASVGAKIFTVDAADNAGNTNSTSASYNVIYSFDGFFAPVDNLPTLNIAKAGQIIPLKWRITDAGGVPVTNLTSATVTAVSLACDQGTTTDQMEEYASGSSGLQNLGDGYYQFNWKTPKSYANSCKTLKLSLGEGLVHELLFKFTK